MAVNNDASCLDLVSGYEYPGTGGCSLYNLLEIILGKLTEEHFTQKTIVRQKKVFNRLRKCADSLGVNEYTLQLRQIFLADNQYRLNKVGTGFSKSRYELHRKAIQWIDSYIATGEVDYSPIRKKAIFYTLQSHCSGLPTIHIWHPLVIFPNLPRTYIVL